MAKTFRAVVSLRAIFFSLASDENCAVINEIEPRPLALSSRESGANPLKNFLASDVGVIVWKLSSTVQTVQTS